MTEPNHDGLQRCVVCGRLFIRRPEPICSMTCKLKAEENNTDRLTLKGSR
jgi:hypothetical protein